MKRLVFILAFIASMLGLIFATGGIARAHPGGICDQAAGGKCFNAWNGGPYVKVNDPGTPNSDFSLQSLGTTTTNNPIVGNPVGLTIVGFVFTPGVCVSDLNNNPNDAHMAVTINTCNGQGWGSRFVAYQSDCTVGFNTFVNVHWSPNWTNRAGAGWNGSTNGTQIWMNVFHTTKCLVPQ
jgi:hypothetical protein